MACLTVETTLIVFGTINLVSSAICFLYTIAMFIVEATDFLNILSRKKQLDAPTTWMFVLYLGILILAVLFSVCLLRGLQKKQTMFLKSYIVFGICLLIVMPLMLTYTYFCFYEWRERHDTVNVKQYAIVAMIEGYSIGALIYIPFLFLVYRTSKKYENNRKPIELKPLVLYISTTETN